MINIYDETIYPDNTKDFDSVSLDRAKDIELFFKANKYIKEEDIEDFLDYIIMYSRMRVCGPETPKIYTMAGQCSTTAKINYELLNRIGLKTKLFNVNKLIGTSDTMHSLCSVKIPIVNNGILVYKEYILDPTFKQFCTKKLCSMDRYYDEKTINNIGVKAPSAGYFLSMGEDGMNFTKELTNRGYFEATDDNLKRYLDAFTLSTKGEEYYGDKSLVGKINKTNISSKEYKNRLNNIISDTLEDIVKVSTPIEIYNGKRELSFKKLFTIIKNKTKRL